MSKPYGSLLALSVLGICAATITTTANAVAVNALLNEYNAIVLSDFTPGNSEIEGTLYVGGNIEAGNVGNINARLMSDGSLGGALVVGGNIDANFNIQSGNVLVGGDINGNLNNNGQGNSFTLGGTLNGNFNANGTPVFENANVVINPLDIRLSFESLSTSLSALTDTGSNQNNGNVTSVAGLNGIAVINANSSFLSGNLSFADNGITTVVNISGATINTQGFNFNGEFENVIFNFFEATDIDILASFGASILAPFANLSNTSDIRGTVVANNYQNSGQIIPPTFNGNLPAVPVPAAAWLFGSALLGLACMRRNRTV